MRHNDTINISLTTMSRAERDAFIAARHIIVNLLSEEQLDTVMFDGQTARQKLVVINKIMETL